MPTVHTLTYSQIRRGVYRITIWAGDEKSIHGYRARYIIKSAHKRDLKIKELKEIYGITESF